MRLVHLSGHQVDAIKASVSSIEARLQSIEDEHAEALKRYERAQHEKDAKAEEVGHPHSSAWWNAVGKPHYPRNRATELTVQLERLQTIVADFEGSV